MLENKTAGLQDLEKGYNQLTKDFDDFKQQTQQKFVTLEAKSFNAAAAIE